MAIYAIGDIQGCLEPLQRLLALIDFDATGDTLWLCGDLVNRGPDSAGVVRWARSLGDRVVTVLGNHDLHLLSVAEGVREPRAKDTFHDLLEAPDAVELLDWLAARPLLHVERDYFLVHAGLLPKWTFHQAVELARRAESVLRGPERARLLRRMSGASPQWRRKLPPGKKLATAVAAMTRLRTCTADGHICHDFSGPPELAPVGYYPWYSLPKPRWASHRTALFGHWAALGHRSMPKAIALDSGCCWGGHLTAVRLEDRAVFAVPAHRHVERVNRKE